MIYDIVTIWSKYIIMTKYFGWVKSSNSRDGRRRWRYLSSSILLLRQSCDRSSCDMMFWHTTISGPSKPRPSAVDWLTVQRNSKIKLTQVHVGTARVRRLHCILCTCWFFNRKFINDDNIVWNHRTMRRARSRRP